MLFLQKNQHFPPSELTDSQGILAFSLSLETAQLIEAYHKGIFPWYNPDEPVIWWCPDPRMVLFPNDLKVSKSMRKIFRDNLFTFTTNQAFPEVIRACQKAPRPGQDGTWISQDIIKKYTELHHLGYAHSIEVWDKDNQLVGGLYGIKVKSIFCGESMFAKVSNASKAGFIWYVQQNNFDLIDCQIYTDHLASLGAKEIPREVFLSYL